jgi:hypothetical protein
MPRRIIRTATIAMAAVALGAPTALARPDAPSAVAKADAVGTHKQDARSPDAIDAARLPRTHDQATNAPAAAVDSATGRPLPGPPTWAVNPQPITTAPAAKVTDGGNGVDWMTIGLGIGGSLLAVGGLAALTSRRDRRTQRLRASA